MSVMKIRLPYLKPPLSLNQRMHWAPRRNITADIRQSVATLAREQRQVRGRNAGWPVTPPVTVELVWTVTDRIRRDTDNPMPTVKAAIDGLRDSGLLPDDDSETVLWSRCRIERGEIAGLMLVVSEAMSAPSGASRRSGGVR